MTKERTIRMLLVEDSEDEAFLLRAELNARGVRAELHRVDSDVAFAAALNDKDWDIVVCDHNMPGYSSSVALRTLKSSGKDIPFIIYSGQISDQQATSAMHDGVQDYIDKGNYARLLPVIDRELRNAAARRAVKRADDRIQELAYYDSLSSLPNHNLFCSRVTEWVLGSTKNRMMAAGAIFYIDLDRFLRINASFGYEVGNNILRQLSQRLRAALSQEILVARLSGDAFGVFHADVAAHDALRNTVEAIRSCFAEPFVKGAVELYITASIGIARLPGDGKNVYELLMNAETAMAYAKRAGGNCAEFYRHDMNANSVERVAMESDLRHAVERGQMFLDFQPCVDAATGAACGAEALSRWRHPQHGLVPPDRFIPIADESGLIVDIGEWVLRQACTQGRIWADRGYGAYVAVNVSAVQFAQPRLLEIVSRALSDTGFPAELLQLEITESVLMRDAESTIGMLRAFKGMGVRISVDDFGTGYSSLSYLKRFPIDVLKIDKSFVRDLMANEDDAAIVRAIIALARSLRLTTVAEGVETAEQAALLGAFGCDRFQGYHFARPLDPEGVDAHLAANIKTEK